MFVELALTTIFISKTGYRKNKLPFSSNWNVLEVGLGVKHADKRSKIHLFLAQSSQINKVPAAKMGFIHGGILHRLHNLRTFFSMLVQLRKLEMILCQQRIGIAFNFLRQAFVKDKPQNVIAEFIRIHLAAQCIGNIPELLLKLMTLFFGHIIIDFLAIATFAKVAE